MASFLTSFGTGVATGGLNQLNAAAEKTASILDELRPDIETKFNTLKSNANTYTKILKIASKYDNGKNGFNYFFDRGEIDLEKSPEENAKYILNNMNAIPEEYTAGSQVTGLDRIQQSYEGDVDSVNNYISQVSQKHKLGNRTSDLLLNKDNSVFGQTANQLNVPVNTQAYAPGVLGGTLAEAKEDLLMNTSKMNAYITTNLNRQPTMADYTNPDIAENAGAMTLSQRDLPLLRDAIGEKDYFNEAIMEGTKQYIANNIAMFNTEGETSEAALNRILNQVSQVYETINTQQGDSTGSPPPSTDYQLLDIQSRLMDAEEGTQEYLDIVDEYIRYKNS